MKITKKQIAKLVEIYEEKFPNDPRIRNAVKQLTENIGDGISYAAQRAGAASTQAVFGRTFNGKRVVVVYTDISESRLAACAAAAIEHLCMAENVRTADASKAEGLELQALAYAKAAGIS